MWTQLLFPFLFPEGAAPASSALSLSSLSMCLSLSSLFILFFSHPHSALIGYGANNDDFVPLAMHLLKSLLPPNAPPLAFVMPNGILPMGPGHSERQAGKRCYIFQFSCRVRDPYATLSLSPISSLSLRQRRRCYFVPFIFLSMFSAISLCHVLYGLFLTVFLPLKLELRSAPGGLWISTGC